MSDYPELDEKFRRIQRERRTSKRLLLFTSIGSVIFLVAIVWLAYSSEEHQRSGAPTYAWILIWVVFSIVSHIRSLDSQVADLQQDVSDLRRDLTGVMSISVKATTKSDNK